MQILEILKQNCKTPLAAIGREIGMTAPSVMDRVRKMEDSGVIQGYAVQLNHRALGCDITAFLGVSTRQPGAIHQLADSVARISEVIECHHVTGAYSLVLKVKTQNTASLETLIHKLRMIDGIEKTETMIVLSTQRENDQMSVETPAPLQRVKKERRR